MYPMLCVGLVWLESSYRYYGVCVSVNAVTRPLVALYFINPLCVCLTVALRIHVVCYCASLGRSGEV